MHDIRCQCHRSLEMTIIKGWPLSQYMWHVKEPSLLNGHECQAYRVGQNLKPFAIYGEVSINAWKILKWNNKSETNKPKWVRVTCTEEWGPLISIMYFNRIIMGNQLKSKCSYVTREIMSHQFAALWPVIVSNTSTKIWWWCNRNMSYIKC